MDNQVTYVPRKLTPHILEAAQYFPALVITGPRQTGKTTLCRHIFPDYTYYNLEDISLRSSVERDPKGFLAACGDKVIIDECQNFTDLFSYIQVAVDERRDRRFVLTGSNNFSLMEKATQSMAGRAAVFTLLPFALDELPAAAVSRHTNDILVAGFYPATLFRDVPPRLFYTNYYTTYIERDVRQLKNISDLGAFQKLVRLIAGRVGSEVNASSLANETGISSPTVTSWINVMAASYIVYTLPPYYANISKRLTKRPKLYFYDSGLLCFLLGITEPTQLATHPLRGAVFENMVVSQLLKQQVNSGRVKDLYFYRENSGREVDVVIPLGDSLDALEIKSSATFNPDFMRGMTYLRELMGARVKTTRLIYDGDSIPPDIFNFRDYFTR